MAMSGGFAMLALMEWVKQPGNSFADCLDHKDPAGCQENAVSQINLDSIDAVKDCTPDAPDQACIRLGRWSDIFTVKARKTGKPMHYADIITVTHEVQIIVT